jgi:hypothetical protein
LRELTRAHRFAAVRRRRLAFFFAALHVGLDGAREQKHGEDDGDGDGRDDTGLDLPPVVNHSADCSLVDELVQAVPALAAELADGPCGGGERKRQKQQVSGHTHGDEAAFGDVGEHGRDVEA